MRTDIIDVQNMRKQLVLKTNTINAEFYISSIAIGVLEGMKAGNINFEEGIWSLGRPVFWECFLGDEIISKMLLKCIQSFDEIDCAFGLSGKDNAVQMIDELLIVLYECQKQSLDISEKLNFLNQSSDLRIESSISTDC